MLTFLEETINHIRNNHKDISTATIILPSKRAGGFLKNYLRKSTATTQFAPKIISIEEFIEELSDLKIIDPTELLFKSYTAYLNTNTIEEKDSFDVYVTWISTLIGDFNEMDRYLIPPASFFSYLKGIQDINHWYVKDEKTELIENYLKFWASLPQFYDHLKNLLLKDNIGYQGLVYREAAESIEHYISVNGQRRHIFIGFNALNNAEQTIVQELLETGHTSVYWDADAHFYNDNSHSASYFLRKYTQEWKYYENHQMNELSNNFQKKKNIQFVEIQKNIGQVKYVGEILSNLSDDEINKTAIILGDEKLILPIIHSLPPNVSNVNLTMGVSLKTFPVVRLFELLFTLQEKYSDQLYYKQVLAILNHPVVSRLLPNSKQLIHIISTQNSSYISFEEMLKLDPESDLEVLNLLFASWKNTSANALNSCFKIISILKNGSNLNQIEKVVLFELHTNFKKIKSLLSSYNYIQTITSIRNLYAELISKSSIDFKGDAYNGLQIMGVLETRLLDFKNLIIVSVNEGIFPSGKSNNSYITYDLKKQFGLPSFAEKDAIYTYHFYRLLHRSERIFLLYNNFSEGLNTGEKSRFLSQLEVDQLANHTLEKVSVNPKINIQKNTLQSINKTEAVITRLKEIAGKGFSPSALTSYIRNPLDFYYQKILQISEFKEVEEIVAANTLGTIVHDALEALYKPLEGSLLDKDILTNMKKKVEEEVTIQFQKTYKKGSFKRGKNLIIFEVAKRYILNFINFELDELNNGNQIKIIKIESNLSADINIPSLNFPVKIRGKIDRLDEYNGQLRIVDYKTGLVQQGELELVDWSIITSDKKYSKIIQVLAYVLMINQERKIETVEGGIISFKNLKNGFLKFATKESARSRTKDFNITQETLSLFTEELSNLIIEICDAEIPFTEKEL
ncbi:MAG: PD-(D/E)XK nuclease family protein [Flavobacteriaceae bacterium]|nr:PD-(D/E)XK nuclease family protein [Flavobacteriaceae bacterium]